jgi:hypothetical protein
VVQRARVRTVLYLQSLNSLNRSNLQHITLSYCYTTKHEGKLDFYSKRDPWIAWINVWRVIIITNPQQLYNNNSIHRSTTPLPRIHGEMVQQHVWRDCCGGSLGAPVQQAPGQAKPPAACRDYQGEHGQEAGHQAWGRWRGWRREEHCQW